MAVGYCTLYGDMAGGLSVLSDIYKTEVYAICNWLNEVYYKKEMIPVSTITKPPSAELRTGQKDSDSLPEYGVLDQLLKSYIEEQKSVRGIVKEGLDADTVKRVIRMVDLNEYKRRQAAPGLRVSAKAFGIGRRLPIVQRWTGHESIN
jgi:NAD+ synthetase